MLFAVALLGGGGYVERECCHLVRHSPSSSKTKNVLKGGKGKIKFLFSTNFQLLSVRRNIGGGDKNKKLKIKFKLVCVF